MRHQIVMVVWLACHHEHQESKTTFSAAEKVSQVRQKKPSNAPSGQNNQEVRGKLQKPTTAPKVKPQRSKIHPGKEVYMKWCQQCHMSNGEGIIGLYSSLVGDASVVKKEDDVAIRIVLHGLVVFGRPTMAGLARQLSDEEIANVLSYTRSAWGNKAAPITPVQVKETRDKYPQHGPWTSKELRLGR